MSKTVEREINSTHPLHIFLHTIADNWSSINKVINKVTFFFQLHLNHGKSAKITLNSGMSKFVGFPQTARSISRFLVMKYVHGDKSNQAENSTNVNAMMQ